MEIQRPPRSRSSSFGSFVEAPSGEGPSTAQRNSDEFGVFQSFLPDTVEVGGPYSAELIPYQNLPDATRTTNQLSDVLAKYEGVDHYGQHPLHVASILGKTDDVKTLLENGISVDTRNQDGFTALHLAAATNREDLIRVLLEHKPTINACSLQRKGGFTPLHIAVRGQHQEAVSALLSHYDTRHEVDIADKAGRTALMMASCRPDVYILQWLLYNFHDRYDLNVLDAGHWSAMDYAKRSSDNIEKRKQKEKIDLLKQFNVRPNISRINLYTLRPTEPVYTLPSQQDVLTVAYSIERWQPYADWKP